MAFLSQSSAGGLVCIGSSVVGLGVEAGVELGCMGSSWTSDGESANATAVGRKMVKTCPCEIGVLVELWSLITCGDGVVLSVMRLWGGGWGGVG